MSRTGGVEKQGRIGRVKETKERGKGRVVNKILIKEMEIPDQLTCLPIKLYAGQEATVRTEHGTMDWFKIEKRVCEGCIVSLIFNLYAELLLFSYPVMSM